MTPDAIGPLLAMANATTVPDAVSLAIDAIEAGASAAEAQQAIDAWVQLQGAQVQQVFAASPPRCRCSHGPSNHTAGLGKCHIFVCACATYRDKEVQ